MAKSLKKQPPLPKATSWSDLYDKASRGVYAERWQKVIIGALHNLGCEHLAKNPRCQYPKHLEWQNHYRGLQEVIMSMVGEYGMDETTAEKQTLDEVNYVRDLY